MSTQTSNNNNNNNRVFIAIPTKGKVSIRWALAFYEILKNVPEGTPYAFDWEYGIAESRQALVDQFLQNEDNVCSHILFLDDDLIPEQPDSFLTKLLNYNKPVVSGIYMNSLNTGGINAWKDEREIKPKELKENMVEFYADKVGLGCCLISREVFSVLIDEGEPKPWFRYRADTLGEDFYFFTLLRNHGIRPYVSPIVKAVHIRELVLGVVF